MNSSNDASGAQIPVLVIFAPTATGKTALLRTLFARSSPSFFKGRAEVISADSMQVYRGMDIGTAKPDAALLSELPHHLIDVCTPDVQFSVADFVERADVLCRDISMRGNIPVIAGGTGFYIRSFLLGLPPTPESDPAVRAALSERMGREGPAALWRELSACDPESASAISPHDAYRIQRALEVYAVSGKPRSSFLQARELRKEYRFLTIILTMERSFLYERINSRTDQMIGEGLEAEARGLIAAGYTSDDPGMKAIGYREWFSCSDSAAAAEQIKADSRAYAKKQYTFIRNIPDAVIIPYDGSEQAVSQVREKIQDFAVYT